MTKINRIAIIVEDESDYKSIRILIKRIIERDNMGFKKAICHGCGKLRRKAQNHATMLTKAGCNMVILVHDLDRNNYEKLYAELFDKISVSTAQYYFVCIPIEEIEAWFLCDLENIKSVFKLDRIPKLSGEPETIPSPKEKISSLVKQHTNNSKIYLNTEHNMAISESISIDKLISKSPSFNKLYEFIKNYKY